MDDLTGTVVLLTGGGRGIGFNTARELTEAGARRVPDSCRFPHRRAPAGAVAMG